MHASISCCAESNQEASHIQDGVLLPAWHIDVLHGHADEHGTSQVTLPSAMLVHLPPPWLWVAKAAYCNAPYSCVFICEHVNDHGCGAGFAAATRRC